MFGLIDGVAGIRMRWFRICHSRQGTVLLVFE